MIISGLYFKLKIVVVYNWKTKGVFQGCFMITKLDDSGNT